MAESHSEHKLEDVRQRHLRKNFAAIFELINKRIDDGIAKIIELHKEDIVSKVQADYLIQFLQGKKVNLSEIEYLKKEEGFCHGITTLKLIGDRLQYEEERKDAKDNPLPIDDKTWFTDQRKRIASFNGDVSGFFKKVNDEQFTKAKNKLLELDPAKKIADEILRDILYQGLDPDIDRFYAKIKEYQDPTAVLSETSQMNLSTMYRDTRDRELRVEYKLTAPIRTDDDLNTVLKAVLREHKLVFVELPKHSMGMSMNEGRADFYDSNRKKDLSFSPGTDTFAKFSQYHTRITGEDSNQYNFIVADLYTKNSSVETKEVSYPDQADVLKSLSFMQNPATLDLKSQQTILHRSAAIGDDESLKFYLELKTVNINAQDKAGATALHHAAMNGFHTTAKLLLEHGADVNLSNPFLTALREGHAKVIKLLLEHGAKFGSKSSLFKAIERGHTEIVILLLNHQLEQRIIVDEKPSVVKVPAMTTNMINTALPHAMKHGSLEMIKTLLDHGAQVNIDTFFAALETGNHKIVELLLTHLKQDAVKIINQANKNGVTPLHKAIATNRLDFVELLLKHGVDIGAEMTENGRNYNSLDIANTLEMHALLLETYKKVFFDAVKVGNLDLVARLLKQQFEGEPIFDKETINHAFDIAIKNSLPEMAMTLLKQGAHMADTHVFTAIQSGNVELADLLLNYQVEDKPAVDFDSLGKEVMKHVKPGDVDMKTYLLQLDGGNKVTINHIVWLNSIVTKLSKELQNEIDKINEEKVNEPAAKKFFLIVVRLQQELDKPKVTSAFGSFFRPVDPLDIIYTTLDQIQKTILHDVELGLPQGRSPNPKLIEPCPASMKQLAPS